MSNENSNVSYNDLYVIFADELRIYLSLEKSINELMEGYENEPSEVIKGIILKLIRNAKDQNHIILDLISKYFNGVKKIEYSNFLGKKLNDLQEIEEKINKTKSI